MWHSQLGGETHTHTFSIIGYLVQHNIGGCQPYYTQCNNIKHDNGIIFYVNALDIRSKVIYHFKLEILLVSPVFCYKLLETLAWVEDLSIR